MKTLRIGLLLSILVLATLALSACQPAALGTINSPGGQGAAATQPVVTGSESPAALPTDSSSVTVNTPSVEPGEVLATAGPSGEGMGLPQTGMQLPDGWNMIADSSNGYSLAYPPEWEACEEHPMSRIFCEIQAEPAGMGPPLRLYLSVYPQDYSNTDFDVYNFIPMETVRAFMALPVGEAMLKYPDAMAPEYFTYTRLPDQMVAGWTAPVVENSQVWEFPQETKERVVMVVTEGTTYIIGMYYETPQQLRMFEQVLESFQLIP